jgi:hypothetical protein
VVNPTEPAGLPLAGTVRVDGRPLKSGTLILFPYGDGKTITTVSASETIRNGRFAIPRATGPPPGKYRIGVFAGRDEGVDQNADSPEKIAALAKDKLPARFNLESELAVEIKRRPIKELRIDIESK